MKGDWLLPTKTEHLSSKAHQMFRRHFLLFLLLHLLLLFCLSFTFFFFLPLNISALILSLVSINFSFSAISIYRSRFFIFRFVITFFLRFFFFFNFFHTIFIRFIHSFLLLFFSFAFRLLFSSTFLFPVLDQLPFAIWSPVSLALLRFSSTLPTFLQLSFLRSFWSFLLIFFSFPSLFS